MTTTTVVGVQRRTFADNKARSEMESVVVTGAFGFPDKEAVEGFVLELARARQEGYLTGTRGQPQIPGLTCCAVAATTAAVRPAVVA